MRWGGNRFLRLAAALALAWGAASVGVAQEETRSFRVLGYGEGFFEGIHFERSQEEAEEKASAIALRFLPNQRSRLYTLPAAVSEVSFYRVEKTPKGGDKKVEVASVRLLEGSEASLLVFFEMADFGTTGKYDIVQLDESPELWSAGCFRFLNLTGAELECEFGDRRLDLPLDASEILRFDPEARGPLKLNLFVLWQGVRKRVLSTWAVADPLHPKLLVLRPPALEGSLKIELQTLW